MGGRAESSRACLLAAIGWVLPAPAASQTQAEVAPIRITITGSHISRIDAEEALPVRVIRREEIERRGAVTLEGLLQNLPANINAFNEAMSVGNVTSPGLSSANLRGLGSGSTLVLLDGRRLANYAFDGESVDLGSIPLTAIDRVEVLTDGASAIYGSDAIGGVINVILRKDFVGAQISVGGRLTEQGGGNQRQAGFDAGFGDPARDGYNVFVSLAHLKQDRLASRDREFAHTAQRADWGLDRLVGATFPANIVDRAGRRFLNPAAATGCMPPISLPFRPPPFFSPVCGIDPALWTDLLPSAERTSALVRGSLRLNSNLELFAEALVARHRLGTQTAPLSIYPFTNPLDPTRYPANGPYYPTAFASANGLSGDLVVAYSAVELGPRLNTVTSVAQRYVVGLQGQHGEWDFNLAAVRSTNRQDHAYGGGWLYVNRLTAALRTGLIDPWGPSAPEGQALLSSTVFNGTPQNAHATTSQLTAVASRPVVTLPAGAMMLALGGEVRSERLSYLWDPEVLLDGFSPGTNVLQSKRGQRDVQAVHAELSLPVLRELEAKLAVRHDRYSDFGGTTNPKVALRWQPDHQVLVRGSWGTGFRAPPLYSLDAPPGATGPRSGRDPVRCPVTGSVNDCVFVALAYIGGNPALQPETSEQRSIGVVWQPTKTLSLGLDHWRVELDGVIAPLEIENALRYYDTFAGRFTRGPVEPAYPDLPGPIVGVNLSPINQGSTVTSGFDASAMWSKTSPSWGRVQAALHMTYVARYETQLDGVQFVSRLGNAVFSPPIPRRRAALTLDWSRGAWGATLSPTYSASYFDQFPGPDGRARKVGATSNWDLQLRYTGWASQRWTVGIQNLFDSKPPSSNQTRTIQVGYNPQLSNPLGRTLYVMGTFTFN